LRCFIPQIFESGTVGTVKMAQFLLATITS
jgi:hypothetical protein